MNDIFSEQMILKLQTDLIRQILEKDFCNWKNYLLKTSSMSDMRIGTMTVQRSIIKRTK